MGDCSVCVCVCVWDSYCASIAAAVDQPCPGFIPCPCTLTGVGVHQNGDEEYGVMRVVDVRDGDGVGEGVIGVGCLCTVTLEVLLSAGWAIDAVREGWTVLGEVRCAQEGHSRTSAARHSTESTASSTQGNVGEARSSAEPHLHAPVSPSSHCTPTVITHN